MMYRRTQQQQQPPRDRIAQQQQMAGSAEFQDRHQPLRPSAERLPGDRPRQLGDAERAERPLRVVSR